MTFLESAVVAAVLLGLANTVAVLALVRAARAGIGETAQGLPLGAAVPAFVISTLDGSRATEHDAAAHLLLFLGASCQPCHQAARELATAETILLRKLLIVVTGESPRRGDNLFDLLGFMPRIGIAQDPAHQIADRLGVSATPFVYALDRAGRVRAKSVDVSIASLKALAHQTGPA
jgi:hypothetical protein